MSSHTSQFTHWKWTRVLITFRAVQPAPQKESAWPSGVTHHPQPNFLSQQISRCSGLTQWNHPARGLLCLDSFAQHDAFQCLLCSARAMLHPVLGPNTAPVWTNCTWLGHWSATGLCEPPLSAVTVTLLRAFVWSFCADTHWLGNYQTAFQSGRPILHPHGHAWEFQSLHILSDTCYPVLWPQPL